MEVRHDNHLINTGLRAFEKKIVAGDMKTVLWTIQNPDKGPFGSYMAALYLSKLISYKARSMGHFTGAVIEETMIEEAFKGLSSSFNDEYWEMWLEGVQFLTNSEQGWEARKNGWPDKADAILRPLIKPLYKRVSEICNQHDTRDVQSYFVKGLPESLVECVMKYIEWNESPADYGVTLDLLDKIYLHGSSDCLRRRLQDGIFATPKESAIWQIEWEIERFENIKKTFDTHPLDVTFPSKIDGRQVTIEVRLEEMRRELEEVRKQ